MSEGLWGAALMFFNVLFAALITFNFYEPLAQLIVDQAGSATVSSFADSVSMMLLFVVSLLLLRLATETHRAVDGPVPDAALPPRPGRLRRGRGRGHDGDAAAGLPGIAGAEEDARGDGLQAQVRFYTERFDRDFLAFFQYTSGYTFARNGAGDPRPRSSPAKPMLFDPKAEWLLVHQQARPYGTEAILEETPDADATAAAPVAPRPPVHARCRPAADGRVSPGRAFPEGTAGAAAGLAPTNP